MTWGRKQILEILASIKGKTTVLFSTHILSDVERICDRIAVLMGALGALWYHRRDSEAVPL